MKRYFILLLSFLGILPYACDKGCDDPRAYTVEAKTIDFLYHGTKLTSPPVGDDTFRFSMNNLFKIQAHLSGDHNYAEAATKPFWDGGLLMAREACLSDYSTNFKPGIDSFVLRANRNIGLVPVGESLNEIFNCDYAGSTNSILSLKALNEGIQDGSINIDNYLSEGRYRLNLIPQNFSFYGSHVFTLEVYLKDQSMVSHSTDVLILE
ncbi:MAG: hypothetical protein EP332_10215 [Bacteroidetes bacterium]|nr:MAG: hypothetical protein EP332_10215 [Bacteroidota bacterium]